MAENKMNEVAKLLGVELEEKFKVYGWDEFCKITELGLERYVKERSWLMDSIMLTDLIKGTAKIIKIPKQILDEKEKEYLSAVIKPFRKHIITIRKIRNYECEFIEILIYRTDKEASCEVISFPYFNKGKMYKGMEINKEYTLKDLGL